MHCDEVRDILMEFAGGEYPAGVGEHVRACAVCESVARDWQALCSGLAAMAAESVPEPSFGFASRVARRCGEAEPGQARDAFFERVGRRFVYAALVLAVTLLLVMILPSTGPVRAPTNSEIYLAQPEEVAAQNDTIFPGQSVDDVSYRPQPKAAGGLGSK